MKPQAKLERYLKQASRGIWGKKKLEVMFELRGNIESRVWMLEQQGFSSFQALEMALDELGKPSEINAGMVKVHAMPKLMKAFAVAVMLSSLAVVNVNLGTAQVTGVAELPIKQCTINPKDNNTMFFKDQGAKMICQGFWLSISSLQTVLKPFGVNYELRPNTVDYTSNHIFLFPNNVELMVRPGTKIAPPGEKNPVFDMTDASKLDFVPGNNLFDGLAQMTVPTSISGWDNPKVQIGLTSFTLGTIDKPVTGDSVYGQMFSKSSMARFFPTKEKTEAFFTNTPGSRLDNQSRFDHFLKVKNSTPGTIYVMLYRAESKYFFFDSSMKPIEFPYQSVDISPVFKTGFLIYRTPAHKLEFVTSAKELKIFKYGGTSKTILMRFNGDLNANAKSFEVVPADQITEVKHPGR
jgi:hypothetical protein